MNKKEFGDWAAEVGSKDIVELIYHDFKNDKLAKDSAVCKFYNIYEKIKDLSLKDPKKFIKLYGWTYKDKIKDKELKKELKESHKKLPSYLAKYGATHFSELWEVVNCKDPIEEFNLTNEEEKKVYSEIEKLVKGINKENFKKNIKAVYDLGKKCGSNDALFQITPYAWEAICKKEGLDEKTGKSLKENKYGGFKMKERLSESELCSRDTYNKRQREINKENDATLAYGKIDDAMSAEFVKDSFFKNVPGSHHWSETVGNLAFVCSIDEDNCSRAHFSTYKNKKRIDSKYVYLNGDCVEQFYEYISDWV